MHLIVVAAIFYTYNWAIDHYQLELSQRGGFPPNSPVVQYSSFDPEIASGLVQVAPASSLWLSPLSGTRGSSNTRAAKISAAVEHRLAEPVEVGMPCVVERDEFPVELHVRW